MTLHNPRNILITGGSGFIGSNFIRYILKEEPSVKIYNLDKLTYCGNIASLRDVEERFSKKGKYIFINGDITDFEMVRTILSENNIDTVVHFAAESHVDRSILGPEIFIKTNILGTFYLLEACRSAWGNRHNVRFHHVSTDEVYGRLSIKDPPFNENTPYDPSSPYSASKASSDHLVRAWHRTYGLNITITNCSNNYGPYQFPEKLIPLVIINCLQGKEIPIYGEGENIRDWLYVSDHCSALKLVLKMGKTGKTYNIGGRCERRNIDLVRKICRIVDELGFTARGIKTSEDLISFVNDRPGHDLRYAMDTGLIEGELNWHPKTSLDEGLRETVLWYANNKKWWENILSGEYKKYYAKWYGRKFRENSSD